MTTPSQSSQLLLLHILVLLGAGAAAIADEQQDLLPITRPGCPDKCGDISIPFPFGLKPGCFLEGFQITCNHSFQPPRAFLADDVIGGSGQTTGVLSYTISNTGNYSIVDQHLTDILPVELIDISLAKNEARVYGGVASVCRTNATSGIQRVSLTTLAFLIDGPNGPFLVSLARNVLVGVGVEVQPMVFRYNTAPGSQATDYLVDCHSTLMENLHFASNGSCSGRGCCQASLPESMPLTGVMVRMPPNTLNNSLWVNTPCSLAMVVEHSWYNFSTADLYGNTSNKFPRGVPYVIDFAIRNAKCPAKGEKPPPNYACVSGNSSCSNVTNGYICKCLEHYEGNPYIPNGCQDIDECKRPDLYPCSRDGICKNRLLGYDCPCKPGMKGDGKTGTCHDIFPLVAKMVVGIIGGFFIFVALLLLILLRKEKKKTREFYEKNGGPILEKAKITKILKKKELKEILKSKHLIGEGRDYKVYKGLLDNKSVVVKKPKSGGAPENNKQFANEIITQSQVIHKNIVRLIGCCIEVDIPVLVYEFISNKSLEDILHGNNMALPLNIDVRLSIAAQSADGLAYMHSKTNNPIIHGDLKPANIFLDDNFMPKISNFDLLIARDNERAYNDIGGRNYMDSVYLQTRPVTEKNDVYSFGVVILELISRKKATDDNNLVRNFLEAQKEEKKVAKLFDNEIALASNLELLHNLAWIAMECLNLDVDQRPSMSEVAERLLLLNRSRNL